MRSLYVGLAAFLVGSTAATADLAGKPVLPTGNNPYNWTNIESIVSNVTDVAMSQTGSYSNSFRVRCYFSGIRVPTNLPYAMDVFGTDGQLYGSVKVPTDGRAQIDLMVGRPSLSDPARQLNAGEGLYLVLNYTNGLAYALPFSGLLAIAGENITLTEANTSFRLSRAITSVDSDGDGQSNYKEFVAGTNPYDPTDYFKINGLSRQDDFFTVRWNGGSRTVCDILTSSDLSRWQPAKQGIINNTVTIKQPSEETSLFYMIRVQPHD